MASLAALFAPRPTPRPDAYAPWQTNTPLPRPTMPSDMNPESRLTMGQRVGLEYSRNKYADGSYQIDPPGSALSPGNEASITSFYGGVQQLPDGSFINFPTYSGRQVMSPAAALPRALQYERQTGQQFARYPTQNAAEWGEMQMVHPIMDRDAQAVLARPEAQAALRAMLTRGGR